MQKQNHYIIQVSVTPDHDRNEAEPYMWSIHNTKGEGNRECHGWESTPEEAWKTANFFYKKLPQEEE